MFTYGCTKIIKRLYLYMKEWDLTFVKVLIPDIIWVLRKSVIKKKIIREWSILVRYVVRVWAEKVSVR